MPAARGGFGLYPPSSCYEQGWEKKQQAVADRLAAIPQDEEQAILATGK